MHVAFRIVVNLSRKIWRHVWYPLTWVWQRIFSITVTLGFAYLLWVFFSGEEPPERSTRPPLPGITAQQTGAASPNPGKEVDYDGPIDPVLKRQDGNSIFSEDLLPKMTAQELRQYSTHYYYALRTMPDGETYTWDFYNIKGKLTLTGTFTNNLGDTCRRFEEVLKVHEVEQAITGMGCKKRGGGWCKLRPTSTPACDLGRKGGIGAWWMDTKRSITDLFR